MALLAKFFLSDDNNDDGNDDDHDNDHDNDHDVILSGSCKKIQRKK